MHAYSTQLYVVGAADSVLIREVSFVQSVLYREVPLHELPSPSLVSRANPSPPSPPLPTPPPPYLPLLKQIPFLACLR